MSDHSLTEKQQLEEMGFLDHLGELRSRIFYALIAISIGAITCYYISNILFEFFAIPFRESFGENLLIGTGPAEAFLLKLKLSVFAGCILVSPFLFYQLWKFLTPGLYATEKKLLLPFIVLSTMLFLIGVSFCYWVVLPFAFEFFHNQYLSIGITPTIRISEHLSLILRAMLGFGIVFEMPVLAYFLKRVGLLTADHLIHGFRYAVVVIFLLSAILTPPDILTQFLMAGPLLLLYGLSILIIR